MFTFRGERPLNRLSGGGHGRILDPPPSSAGRPLLIYDVPPQREKKPQMRLSKIQTIRLPEDIEAALPPAGRARAAFIRDAIRMALDERQLLTKEEREGLAQMTELLRQAGINLNQIARALNAAALGGPDPNEKTVRAAIDTMEETMQAAHTVLHMWERGI